MKLKDFNAVAVNWHVDVYNVQGKTWKAFEDFVANKNIIS